MQKLNNVLSLPRLSIYGLAALRKQKRFVRQNINPIVAEEEYRDLTKVDLIKIRESYGFNVPAIWGEALCMLRGKSMSIKERFTMTYLGSLTGLYDDFFDNLNTSEDHILDLTLNPFEANGQNLYELLFLRLYQEGLKHAQNPLAVKQRFREIYEAQIESKKQLNSNLSKEEIRKITLLKGGKSYLFYRMALSHPLEETEADLLYSLGGLMQFESDIFDIYQDHQDNISTVPTLSTKIADLRTEYSGLYQAFVDRLARTNFTKRNKHLFIRYINVFLCTGYVCLDCLEKNERFTHGVFSLKEYSRKQLICDMEKLPNIISAFQYFVSTDLSNIK